MDETLIALLAAGGTLLAYAAARKIHSFTQIPLLTPVFVATALIVAVLAMLSVPYGRYLSGSHIWIDLLGPATASLAIPLYKHRQTMRTVLLPALAGLTCGAFITLATVITVAALLRLPAVVVASIGFKSVTASIGAELAPMLHGDATMAVTFAVATGILGAMFGPLLLNGLGVRSPLARGLAFGTVSTGIGTSQALAEGELQGAAAATSMALAGVFASFVTPQVIPWVLHCCQVVLR